jgi:hypothetical protein
MGKLDEIGQSEHWEGEMGRARTSSKNDRFTGPMVGDVSVSVPMFLKPGMFIFTNNDKINIYDIHTLRNFSFTQMIMKISLFTPTSDILATINAVVFQYTVIYDE